MTEFRKFGPPGTGKTTSLARDIENAVAKYGEESVLVCSYTKAAATEISGRVVKIAKHMMGTLHSICFRVLGNPSIAELKFDSFNDEHPQFKLSGDAPEIDDGLDMPNSKTQADNLLWQYQYYRSRMIPRDGWPNMQVRAFGQAWEGWKERWGLLDYTDLIDSCLHDVGIVPGDPAVLFVDEAQDLSTMQFALIRKWGAKCDFFVMIGDDDQSIYNFAGADARNLFTPPLPDEQVKVLHQSFRVPRAVHSIATKWIEGCRERQPKTYNPRDDDGEIAHADKATYKYPDPLIADIEGQLAIGRTCMVIGSCTYMLDPIVRALREAGIPFHNPYRKAQGAWNPIREGDTSTLARFQYFMRTRPDGDYGYTAQILHLWVDLIQSKGILKHGAKKKIAALAESNPGLELSTQDLGDFFEPVFFDATMNGPDPNWLLQNATLSKRERLTYPYRLWQRYGEKVPKPAVTVGTIHSVKGGEADCVYLFPDLSREGALEWQRNPDPVRRLFYVGMTRARSRLVLPAALAQPFAVNLSA